MSSPTLDQVRALHRVGEAVHAILYFSGEVQARWNALDLQPRSEGYVVGRAAPLGPVGPEVAAATFFNFNPALFHRFLPAAWDKASPTTALSERAAGLQETFERVGAPAADLDELVDLLDRSADGMTWHGRPLAAGNAGVAAPEQPFARAWQSLAVLREHRGDGHVAALLGAQLDPVEALVVMAGWQDQLSRRFLQGSRMWDDDAWQAGVDRLRGRGLVDEDGQLTDDGAALRDRVEHHTDLLAAEPYQRLGAAGCRRLFALLHPLAVALRDGGAYPRTPAFPDAYPEQ